MRVFDSTAIAFILPDLTCCSYNGSVPNTIFTCPPTRSVMSGVGRRTCHSAKLSASTQIQWYVPEEHREIRGRWVSWYLIEKIGNESPVISRVVYNV